MYLVAFQRLVDRYGRDIGREALVRYWDGNEVLSGSACATKHRDGWAGVDRAVIEHLIARKFILPFKTLYLNVSHETLCDSSAFDHWLDQVTHLKKHFTVVAEVSARHPIPPDRLASRVSMMHFAGIGSLIEDLDPAAASSLLPLAAWDMCKIAWDPTTAQTGLADLQEIAAWCAKRALPVQVILENVERYADLARAKGLEIFGAQGFVLDKPVLFDDPLARRSKQFLKLEVEPT